MTTMTNEAKPASLSETETIIAEMLRESTGAHFLDSGSAYGRHHERNRSITDAMWKGSEPASLSFRFDYPEVTLSVFHFLAENLEHDAEAERVFRIVETARDTFGLESTETFLDVLREADDDASIAGIYNEGEPVCVNTCNGEDLLSPTIQYHYASIEASIPLAFLARIVAETEPDCGARDDWKDILREAREAGDDSIRIDGVFVFLQVHGGCDVRGGYTDVRVFQESGSTELGILDNARATIFDSSIDGFYGSDREHPAYWTTDDGCHWYADGCAGAGAHPQLETFDIRELPEAYDADDGLARLANEAHTLAGLNGQTGAVRILEARIAEASEAGDDEAETIAYLMKASLTGETLPFLPRTSDGAGFSPYTLGRLEASPH